MRNKKHISLLIILLPACAALFAQEEKYRFVHFEEIFKPGIYITFDDFRLQTPVKKTAVIAMEDPHDPDFLMKILSYEHFAYFDSLGNKMTVKSSDIWGVVRRNTLFLLYGQLLSKVHFNGRWGYFTTYEISSAPNMSVMPGAYYAMQVPLKAGKKTRSMIIDLKTGQIQRFKRKNLSELLSNDTVLKTEYKSLSRRKQKQLKYLYLRKLNDKVDYQFPNVDKPQLNK